MQTRPFFGRYAVVPAYPAPGYAVYPPPAVYYFGAASPPAPPPQFGAPPPPPPPPRAERELFYERLHAFRAQIRQPISRLPTLGFKELDLWTLYREVTRRRGIDAVIARKQWKEVAEALRLPSSCTDSGFRLRLHYKKYLEAFERKFFQPPPLPPPARNPVHSAPPALSPCPSHNSSTARPAPPRRKKRRVPPAPPKPAEDTRAKSDNDAQNSNSAPSTTPSDDNNISNIPASTPRNGSDAGSERGSSGGSSGGSAGRSASTLWSLCGADAAGDTPAGPIAHVDPPTSPAGSDNADSVGNTCMRRQVDFSVLEPPSLERYARHYGLQQQAGVDASDELARKVSAHFSQHSIADAAEEARTLREFVHAVRNKRRRVVRAESSA